MVVIRKRDGAVVTVPLGDKPGRLDDDGKEFSRLKTLALDHQDGAMVVWTEKGKLERRLVSARGEVGPIEAIADDAEDGYPPGGTTLEDGRAVVIYVAKRKTADGERRVRAWIEGAGAIDVFDEGGSASTVAAVRLGKHRVAALWLDGRSAIAPVHRATIDAGGAAASVSAESTVFVAPPSELATELAAGRLGDDAVALFATPKNGTSFGLALVPAVEGAAPRGEVPWRDYPNGLDPAPVAAVTLCGRSAVVFVEPTDKPVEAPRSIELATIDDGPSLGAPSELGRAKRVDHVAAWAAPSGDGWVLWVGDGRTLVRHVGCKK